MTLSQNTGNIMSSPKRQREESIGNNEYSLFGNKEDENEMPSPNSLSSFTNNDTNRSPTNNIIRDDSSESEGEDLGVSIIDLYSLYGRSDVLDENDVSDFNEQDASEQDTSEQNASNVPTQLSQPTTEASRGYFTKWFSSRTEKNQSPEPENKKTNSKEK